MRIAFFGTSEFVGSVKNARFLRRLVSAGLRPAAVVTAPDVPGRGVEESVPLAVKSVALEFGLPVFQPSSLKELAEELADQKVELALVVAYGHILPPEVLAVPKFGSLNVHPSLLPHWRGPTPIQTTILAGEAMTGVTIIQMDEQMDHGPIIAKREFPLGQRAWTAPALSDALTDLGVELFLEILEPWAAGKIPPQAQNHAATTYSRKLKRKDGHVDWSKSAVEIERMVRAYQPWPGAYAVWQRGDNSIRLSLEEAGVGSIGAETQNLEAGAVYSTDGSFGVRCGDGTLLTRRLKREGGRSMRADEFLRGHPDILSAVLE